MMTEQDKLEFINKLDEELLKGGVILSEWSTFLIRDADVAFQSGAHLSAILTSLAAVESHLKYEYGEKKNERLVDLIDKAPIEEDLREDLHLLRKYRNKWVHVNDPGQDDDLLTKPDKYEEELEKMACLAIKSLRRSIYTEQWV
jgi:hypothetical protein